MKRTNILLNPDAADAGDPLSTNVQDIDTSRPRLVAGLYDLKIKEAKKEPTKDGSGERITFVLETTAPAKSTDGEDLPVGQLLWHYIGITEKPAGTSKAGKPTDAYTLADVAKNIAKIAKGARYNGSAKSIIDNPAVLKGETVRTKVGIQKETDEWPESNNIKEFLVIK